jgi:predicted alpha/beta-hydrolase family hydrolase
MTTTRSVRSEVREVDTPAGPARVHRRTPLSPRALVVLGHGAGRGVDTADLQGLAEDLPAHGVAVALVDQPWVVAGRRVAPAPAALDLAWLTVLPELTRRSRVPLVVGGRSAGARVAARTASQVGAAAVLALAVPLRPLSAADPEASMAVRVAELALALDAGIPVVAAQGERDSFGSAELLRTAAPRVDVVPVPGADHSLRVRRADPDPRPLLLAAALRAVEAAGNAPGPRPR